MHVCFFWGQDHCQDFSHQVSDDSTNDMNFHWSLGFVPNISHVCVLLGVSWAAETKTWSCKFSDSHHWKHFLLPLCSITLSQWEYDWKESDTKWPWMSKFLYFGFFPPFFFCLQCRQRDYGERVKDGVIICNATGSWPALKPSCLYWCLWQASERKQQKQTNAFTLDTAESFLFFHYLLLFFSLNLGQTVLCDGSESQSGIINSCQNTTVCNIELRDGHLWSPDQSSAHHIQGVINAIMQNSS